MSSRGTESETEPGSQGREKPKMDEALVKKYLDKRKEEKFFEKEFNKDIKKMKEKKKLEETI